MKRGGDKMNDDKLTIKQLRELVEAHGGADEALRFIANKKNVTQTIVTPKGPLDLIQVDRSIGLRYPFWVREILYEKLNPGPSEFSIEKLQRWFHDQQKKGIVEGYTVHEFLKSHNMIKDCLDLRDLEEIKKKGPTFFERHFERSLVLGWRGTARDGEQFLRTPCLYVDEDGQEDIFWEWLNNDLNFRHLTLMHKK
jgi:hypothetical protein